MGYGGGLEIKLNSKNSVQIECKGGTAKSEFISRNSVKKELASMHTVLALRPKEDPYHYQAGDCH